MMRRLEALVLAMLFGLLVYSSVLIIMALDDAERLPEILRTLEG